MEELDRLGEAPFDRQAPCVVSHHEVGRGFEVIGDEDGRLLMPIAPDDKLAEGAVASTKGDGAFADLGAGEPPRGTRYMNTCPRRQAGYAVEQSFSSAAQNHVANDGHAVAGAPSGSTRRTWGVPENGAFGCGREFMRSQDAPHGPGLLRLACVFDGRSLFR